MLSWRAKVVCAVCAAGLATTGIVAIQQASELSALRPHANAFALFCRMTKVSVQSNLTGLTSNSLRLQRQAFARFDEDRTYFGPESIRICLGDQLPASDEFCTIMDDIPCVTRQVKSYAEQLANRY